MLELILANKNYSSWSMRAWLYLRESGLEFNEKVINLFTNDWKANIKTYSPIGKAPALVVDGDIHLWDSLGIIGFVQQCYPEALQWPTDSRLLAQAWSLTAEMHSGFLGIRNQLPMNLKQRVSLPDIDQSTRIQIQRVDQIWTDCLRQHGGPWLLGEFSIVDIMYVPVAARFVSYGVPVSGEEKMFMDSILARESVLEWTADALREDARLEFIDGLFPIDDTPLTPG